MHTHTHTRFYTLLAATALAVATTSAGTAWADPPAAGGTCTTSSPGGKNPDTTQVHQVTQSAVDAAKAQGLSMGVSIGGAGNTEPVINVGAFDDPMYSASTIKVAVATTVYANDAAANNTDDLRAMIGQSDNEAANRLIDVSGGFDGVNNIVRKAGVSEDQYNLGNRMGGPTAEQASILSAKGGAKYLMALCNAAAAPDGFVPKEVAENVLTLMSDSSIKNEAARAKLGQGEFTRLANKPGENGDVKDSKSVSHDIGIVGGGNHWFALAVTTTGGSGQDSEGTSLVADLAGKLAPLFSGE